MVGQAAAKLLRLGSDWVALMVVGASCCVGTLPRVSPTEVGALSVYAALPLFNPNASAAGTTLRRRAVQEYGGNVSGCAPADTTDAFFRTCEGLGWDTISAYASPNAAVLNSMVTGYTMDYGSATVCGYSRKRTQSGEDVCSGELSWSQAREFCKEAGGRLCTAHELHTDESHGSGCNADFARVWSSTPCDGDSDRGYSTVYGFSGSAPGISDSPTTAAYALCQPTDERAVARCCASSCNAPARQAYYDAVRLAHGRTHDTSCPAPSAARAQLRACTADGRSATCDCFACGGEGQPRCGKAIGEQVTNPVPGTLQEFEVDCANRGLHVSPSDLPAHTTRLYVENNPFVEWRRNTLRNLPKLHHIYVAGWRCLARLPDGVFDGLPSLGVFDSSDLTSMRELPDGLFALNARLHTVVLVRYTLLRKLPSLAHTAARFVRLQAMDVLRIHASSLHVARRTLERLVLVANPSISELPPRFLARGSSLRELLLSDNAALSTLGTGAFAGVSVRHMHVALANASFSLRGRQPFAGAGVIASVRITGWSMHDSARKQFAGLHATTEAALFGRGGPASAGWSVDLFEELTHVRVLDLRKFPVRELRPGAFARLKQLRSLTLARFCQLRTLGERGSLFSREQDAALSRLKIVDMGALRRIQPGFFRRLPRLRSVDLSRNALLQHLEPLTFDGVGSLPGVELEIVIRESRLKHISRRAFNFDARGLSPRTTVLLGSRSAAAVDALATCCGYGWLRFELNFVISGLYCRRQDGAAGAAALVSASRDASCCISRRAKDFISDLDTLAGIKGNTKRETARRMHDTLPPCHRAASQAGGGGGGGGDNSSAHCLLREHANLSTKLAELCEPANGTGQPCGPPSPSTPCAQQPRGSLSSYFLEPSWATATGEGGAAAAAAVGSSCVRECPGRYHGANDGPLYSLECEPWQHDAPASEAASNFYVRERACFPCAVLSCRACAKDARVCEACDAGFNLHMTEGGGHIYCLAQTAGLPSGTHCAQGHAVSGVVLDDERHVWRALCAAEQVHRDWYWLVVMGIAAGCAGLVILCSVCVVVVYRRVKTYRDLQREYMHKEQKLVQEAWGCVDELQFPAYLLRAEDFLHAERLEQHERLRDAHKLTVLDHVADLREFGKRHPFVFFSHQWTSFNHPDPSSAHHATMKAALATLMRRFEWKREDVFVWVDFSCIPQEHKRLQALAIRSLAVYSSAAAAFCVVAPACQHTDLGLECNVETYNKRMWCRAEQVCHALRNGTDRMFVATEAGLVPLLGRGERQHAREQWLTSVMHVFDGESTCCRLKHSNGEDCDRLLLVQPILGLFGQLSARRPRKRYSGRAVITTRTPRSSWRRWAEACTLSSPRTSALWCRTRRAAMRRPRTSRCSGRPCR